MRGQWLEESPQGQGSIRKRGNTEAQKTSSVGAGRGGIYRVGLWSRLF